MTLKEYRRKRNFHKTSEPSSGRGRTVANTRRYVIQKHAASRLHYDFRLELDGTLKSWAVPKGPSLDPHQKQLAVHVEDHPVAYADFEGIIPKGEYGGGTVMVWDQGTWEPTGNAHQQYRDGKLKFILHGKKLHGGWTLVQMHGAAGDDGKNWLLIKEHDLEERAVSEFDIREEEPLSVLSGRDLNEIAACADNVWKSSSEKMKRKSARKLSSIGTRHRSPKSKLSHSATDRLTKAIDNLPDAKRRPLPVELQPQLATLVSAAPRGEKWLHEMKFDGYRLLAWRKERELQLITRNGNDWTRKFPNIAAALQEFIPEETILDGEVVFLDQNGLPNFQRLQNQMKEGNSSEFVYYVFDLPFCMGRDLRRVPLIDRKRILEQILRTWSPENSGAVRYSEHVQGEGEEVSRQSCRHQLEGIVSKEAGSRYESERSRSWVKVKCHQRQEFVIGGYTHPHGSRSGFGALLLGIYERKKLRYCGKVGTGFTAESLRQLIRRLQAEQASESPFEKVPAAVRRQLAHWVKPKLVAEIEFSEWTDEGMLRHPAFKGLREDKPASVIHQEEPQSMAAASDSPEKKTVRKSSRTPTSSLRKTSRYANARPASSPYPDSHYKDENVMIAGVSLSHPDRVIDAESRFTKADVARFYVDISEWILPFLKDRPLSLVRCPSGLKGDCFYQKHFDAEFSGVTKISIQEKLKMDDYAIVRNAAGLVSLVQWGVLEFHPWQGRADDLEHTDRMIFDLDPGPGTPWENVLRGAREIHERLKATGLESFVRTSGGKGLHVVAPLTRRRTFEEVKAFSHALAIRMTGDSPGIYTDNMSRSQRSRRIFVDYLRNGRGATAIASYSTRSRPGLPVATPLRWDELTPDLDPAQYTVRNIFSRLGTIKADPWEGFSEARQTLTKQSLKSL